MTEFIEIDGLVVNQLTSKKIATTSVKFIDLISIAKFTARESHGYDPFNPEKTWSQVFEDVNQAYFQRLTNDDRVKALYIFLLREINNFYISGNAVGSFPTAIIIAVDLNEDYEKIDDYKESAKKLNKDDTLGAYYNLHDGSTKIKLLIPKQKTSLIVDGQHRLAGMLRLYNDACSGIVKIGRTPLKEKYPGLSNKIVIKAIENFSFNCTVLLDFDIWEQGRVFADVNFNQKPVNKSLYYDIFGSVPSQDKNDIFLAHMLAMFLNNNEKSVIKDFIKMLGAGKGYFSQAFFVEAILHHFKSKGVWGHMPVDYLDNGQEFKILPKFLTAYFRAIKMTFNSTWPKDTEVSSREYKNILVKTTGMGALLKLINPIYRDLQKKGFNLNEISENNLYEELMKILKALKAKEEKFFSGSGDFAGAGSLGLQGKLYKELGEEIGYFKK